MKKYFIMAVAVLASLTACQKDPEQIIVNDGTIKFMSVATRGLNETPIVDISTFEKDKSFVVYGFMENEKGNVLTNVLWENGVYPKYSATTSSSNIGQWATVGEEIRYWADAKYYNFYAFYNQGENTVTAAHASTVVAFDGGTNATTDFVAASNCEIRGQVANAPVQLAFKHQLSRVTIKFVNLFNDVNNRIEVTNIIVKAPTAATFTYTAPTAAGEAAVAVDDNANLVSVPFDVEGATDAKLTVNGVADGQDYLSANTTYKYFVPSTGAKSYEMTCDVDFITKVGDKEIVTEKNYTVALPEWEYKAGESYEFIANVYDAVNPITFNVTVKDWPTTNTHAGDVNIGGNKNK